MRNTKLIGLFTGALFMLLTTALCFAESVPVRVEKKEGLGSYLVDTNGMTLYYFKKDPPGKSVCSGDCIVKWPVYLNETVSAGSLNAADFGLITREDGKKQSTFKGMPLYYFFKDTKAGDTLGHGVNNVWYVVGP